MAAMRAPRRRGVQAPSSWTAGGAANRKYTFRLTKCQERQNTTRGNQGKHNQHPPKMIKLSPSIKYFRPNFGYYITVTSQSPCAFL